MKKTFFFFTVIILVAAMVMLRFSSLKKRYHEEVSQAIISGNLSSTNNDLLTEEDIGHLPEPVKKYIRYTGSVGKPKLKNVRISAHGKIRSNPEDDWMHFKSEQYNFFSTPRRFFYIKAKKKGIPALGLHIYKNCTATMEIRLAGLFTIVDAKGPEMDQGETVTLLNDMCFMAPASLIDPGIQWEMLDSLHVKAKYTNGNMKIGAELFFDNDGRLMNFISYDRFETADGKTYVNNPWETPVKAYGEFNGYRLPCRADVIYQRPGGKFCYLEFTMDSIEYNLDK